VYRPEPPYTEEARKAKLSGVVTLAIVVDAQGNPRDIHIMRSLGMGLDEKAVETVSTWKFKPATRKDVPVAVRMIVEITFRLF
jgi:TonB family protein